jgi:protein arginine kinase activator
LMLNIHGEVEHVGKTPHRRPKASERRTQLIRLRREMREAIKEEDYERASRIRDEIQHTEAETS